MVEVEKPSSTSEAALDAIVDVVRLAPVVITVIVRGVGSALDPN